MTSTEDMLRGPMTMGSTFRQIFTIYRRAYPVLAKATAAIIIPMGILQMIYVSKIMPRPIGKSDFDDVTWIYDSDIYGPFFVFYALNVSGGIFLSSIYPRLVVALYARTDGVPNWISVLKTPCQRAVYCRVLAYAFLCSIAVGVASIFLLVPGIYVMVSTAVAVETIVIENASVCGSFRRSWTLTRGKRCFIFWYLLFSYLMVYIVTSVVLGFDSHEVLAKQFTCNGILQVTLLNLLIIPLSATVTPVLYMRLRVQEGLTKEQLKIELGEDDSLSTFEEEGDDNHLAVPLV